MHIFRHFEDIPEDLRGGAVAVGNFDGVHLGHRAVIDEAGLIARAPSPTRPWGVLTFEPHPRLVFKPDQEPFRLTPFRIKTRLIEDIGVDFILVMHFDAEFARRSAESFVEDVIVGSLAVSHLVAGYDFVFGHGRRGNCQLLLEMGQRYGFGFNCVPAVTDGAGDAYSSTRVRDRLKAADPHAAAAVLGHPFEIEGRVEGGDKRGRALGFPTANLHLGEDYLRPAFGVYAVRAGIDRGGRTVWRDGVANFGIRPTFNGHQPVMEAHLFDFDDDLYGKHLRVALVDFIRAEKKFSGIDALRAQIAQDCETAKRLLAESPMVPTTPH